MRELKKKKNNHQVSSYIIQWGLTNSQMDSLFTGTDQLDDVITWSIFNIFAVNPPDLVAWKKFVDTRTAFRHEPSEIDPYSRFVRFIKVVY